MRLSLQLQTIELKQQQFNLYIPDPRAVQQQYYQQKELDTATAFPYWTQIWPAALALSEFILEHPHYVEGKEVLELAAGLGLPSLVAASFAQSVLCTDYLPEALEVIEASVQLNQLTNVCCRQLNWHHLPPELSTEVLLLSDINYDPEAFSVLYQVLLSFLQKGTTIILTTPQRLMAKSFIESLLPFCTFQQEIAVSVKEQEHRISLLILQQ